MQPVLLSESLLQAHALGKAVLPASRQERQEIARDKGEFYAMTSGHCLLVRIRKRLDDLKLSISRNMIRGMELKFKGKSSSYITSTRLMSSPSLELLCVIWYERQCALS